MADEWKAGDEVALVARYGGGYTGRTSKVAKVYKNGNVLIESEDRQQFKPSGDGWLHQTGGTRWGDGNSWVRLTDEVRAQISANVAESFAQVAADKAVSAIGLMVRTKTCAAHIDAINAFLAAIAPDQEGL